MMRIEDDNYALTNFYINKTLDALDEERGKFTNCNEKEMQRLINELVNEGVYPSEPTNIMKKYDYTILDMVKSWGASWYIYEEPFECPNCKADLRDKENGPPFKREIGMSDFYLDRVVDYVCPDCYRSLDNGKQYDKKEFEKSNLPDAVKLE